MVLEYVLLASRLVAIPRETWLGSFGYSVVMEKTLTGIYSVAISNNMVLGCCKERTTIPFLQHSVWSLLNFEYTNICRNLSSRNMNTELILFYTMVEL
jgi:hypothetical protein